MKIFLDANIIYSASRSVTGASCSIFLIQKKFSLKLVTSKLALVEAETNLFEKEKPMVIAHFYELIKNIDTVNVDSEKAKEYYKMAIEEKDAPILYGALKSKSDYLVDS